MKLTDKAMQMAFQLHLGQYRNGSKLPYFYHVVNVSEQLSYWGIRIEEHPLTHSTALMHDTEEESDITNEEIAANLGGEVAQNVKLLTFKGDKAQKEIYMASFATAPIIVVVVKLADRYRNVIDFAEAGDVRYALTYLRKADPLTALIESRQQEIIAAFGPAVADAICQDFQNLRDRLERDNRK